MQRCEVVVVPRSSRGGSRVPTRSCAKGAWTRVVDDVPGVGVVEIRVCGFHFALWRAGRRFPLMAVPG